MKELLTIQQKLNAPKNQYNGFGKYAYRSCEDILMAVKPLLAETECTLTCQDDIALVGDRFYVKATYTLTNKDGKCASASAYAREQEKVTGQIEAQITGATSSYARKYALNALFAIDDNKDPDATNTHGKETPKTKPTTGVKPTDDKSPENPVNEPNTALMDEAKAKIATANTKPELVAIYNEYGPQLGFAQEFRDALNARQAEIKKK